MKESTIYQEIIREGFKKGIKEGRIEQSKSDLLRIGRSKFGRPSAAVKAQLEKVTGLRRLHRLIDGVVVGSFKTSRELLREIA
jgi:predicted transposase YdaD